MHCRVRLCLPRVLSNNDVGSENVNKAVETLGGQNRGYASAGMLRRGQGGMRSSDRDEFSINPRSVSRALIGVQEAVPERPVRW